MIELNEKERERGKTSCFEWRHFQSTGGRQMRMAFMETSAPYFWKHSPFSLQQQRTVVFSDSTTFSEKKCAQETIKHAPNSKELRKQQTTATVQQAAVSSDFGPRFTKTAFIELDRNVKLILF